MSVRSVFVALAALSIAVPGALRAQEEVEADFAKARQQFVAGQARAAANTLLMSSLAVRKQVGRCRDLDVGSRLIDAESQLEKLAYSLRDGKVGSVKTLDQSLTRVDLVLAKHHLQLASEGMKHPRREDIPVVAQDIDRAAFHLERSVTLSGGALAAEQATVLSNARALVKEIESTSAIPVTAADVVAALEKSIGGASPAGQTP